MVRLRPAPCCLPLALRAVAVRSAYPGPRARILAEDLPVLTELALRPLGEIELRGFPAGHLLLVWLDHSAVEEPLTPVIPSLQVLVEGGGEHASERRLTGLRIAGEQPDPGGPIVPVDEATAHQIKLLIEGPACRAGPVLRGLALDQNGALRAASRPSVDVTIRGREAPPAAVPGVLR